MIRKSLSLFLLAQLFFASVFAQKPTCESLHTGSFKVFTKESGTTIIERTEKEQLEKNDDLGYEVIFSIKWIDNCTYELRPKKLIKGDSSIMGDGTFFVKTKIKEITDTGYAAETTASFGDGKVDFLVEIIK